MSVEKPLVAACHCEDNAGVIGLDCYLPGVYDVSNALHCSQCEAVHFLVACIACSVVLF